MASHVKVVKRRGPKIDLRRMVTEWLGLDYTAAQWAERANELKLLMRDTLLPEQGDTDDDGHTWVMFDEDIEDPSGKGSVTAIKREYRKIKRLNAERTEAFLRRKKLWDDCTETVVVINEDAVLAKAFDKTISERDLNSLYDVTESYAFVPQRRGRGRRS